MRRAALLLLASATVLVATAGCGGSSGGGGSSNGKVTIVMWNGQTDVAKKVLDNLAAEFMKSHPNIKVDMTSGGVTTDDMLQKVTTALAAGTYPNIAYLYGSWAANVARSPKVLDIADVVHKPSFHWSDFWGSERQTTTVNGKTIGLPSVVDNLAVIYNKKLLAKYDIPTPSASWSWDDFRAMSKRCTDASTQTYGTAYPVDGSEDVTWRFWPLLWQEGGQILSDDEKQATFNSPAGVAALTLLQQMAVDDKSVYLDPTDQKMEQLFIGNHLCFFVSGPWELQTLKQAHVDYGVQILPAFNGDHETISGPDNWVIFDHGDAQNEAATEFLTWLTSPKQDIKWDLASGSLPVRHATTLLPGYKKYLETYPGVQTMVANLQNAHKARPAVTQYPQISAAVAQAIAEVLLGKQQPKEALDAAADKADHLLSVPS